MLKKCVGVRRLFHTWLLELDETYGFKSIQGVTDKAGNILGGDRLHKNKTESS